MGLGKEFKDQFEEKYRDIVSTDFNDDFDVTDEDIKQCFEAVLLYNEPNDVDTAINNSIIEWLEYNKEGTEKADVDDTIESLETKIAEAESDLANLNDDIESWEAELEELKAKKAESNDWNTVEKVSTPDTWASVAQSDKW
jgi:predicted metalloendopeptidase